MTIEIEKKTVKVNNLEWFYREANPINATDKLPVVLLHGIISQSYSWSVVVSDLATNGYRAIAPDWIGSGASSQPDKRDFGYTPDAFITALSDFLQALELPKFYLVVQGFLGSVGLQYALRNPDQIERLAIVNTPITTTAKLPWKIQQLGLPLIGDALVQDPILVDRTLEGGSRFVISDADLDVYRRPFIISSDAGRALAATIRNLQLAEAMTEISSGLLTWPKPTLMIWGAIDPWLNITDVENYTTLPNFQLVKLAEAGHYPQEHWATEISTALVQFWRQI